MQMLQKIRMRALQANGRTLCIYCFRTAFAFVSRFGESHHLPAEEVLDHLWALDAPMLCSQCCSPVDGANKLPSFAGKKVNTVLVELLSFESF